MAGMNPLKAAVRSALGALGLRLVPRDRDPATLLRSALARHFDAVVDVGASRGETSRGWLKQFPGARVYAVEPYPAAFAELSKLEAAFPERFKAFNAACGEARGTVTFEVHPDHDTSSSVLATTSLCRETLPDTARSERIIVPLERLDDLLGSRILERERSVFLKLDVQGYEVPVLRGAPQLLKRTDVVLTEVTLPEFYQGQSTFTDIHQQMESSGFALLGIAEQSHDERGRAVYFDALYGRAARHGI
jgi:FkbM family methyltransferase